MYGNKHSAPFDIYRTMVFNSSIRRLGRRGEGAEPSSPTIVNNR